MLKVCQVQIKHRLVSSSTSTSTRRYLDRPDGGSKAIKHALTSKHLTQPAPNRNSETANISTDI